MNSSSSNIGALQGDGLSGAATLNGGPGGSDGGGGSAPPAPAAPGGLTTAASGSTVSMSWRAPSSGGAPTGYVVEAGSGALTSILFTPEQQARAASLQIVAIGVMLCVILLVRPNGILGNLTRRPRFSKKPRQVAVDQDGATP